MARIRFLSLYFLAVAGVLSATAQHSTVYSTVVSTKAFIVGAPNPQTGLFYQKPLDDTLWRHTGANNIRAFHVAVHTPSRGRIVCIGSGNGVHRTTDGGGTWKIVTDWRITEVLWVAIDQTDAETIFCGTPYGVYKTSDGGKAWREINNGIGQKFTSSVIIDHSNRNVLYCSTEDGVYRSADAGERWLRTGLSVGGVRIVVQHPSKPGMLFAGTEEHGIYVTENEGRTWSRIEAGLDHHTFYAIAFDPSNPDVMYAGGYVTGVYKSTNGGGSWFRTNEGLINLNVHSIAVDPTDPDRIFAATFYGGVFRSDNGGRDWRNVGLSGSQVWTIIVQPY